MEDLLPGYGVGFLVFLLLGIVTFGLLGIAIIGSILGWIRDLFK